MAKSDLKLSGREPGLPQPGLMMDVDNHDDDDVGVVCDREEGAGDGIKW